MFWIQEETKGNPRNPRIEKSGGIQGNQTNFVKLAKR
jgi:hypothetical protein